MIKNIYESDLYKSKVYYNNYINKNYNMIDVTKFIMSILVIAIHTNSLKLYNEFFDFALVENME
jgi:hypothetical protein